MHRAVADFQIRLMSRRASAHDRCASFYPNALEVCRGIDTGSTVSTPLLLALVATSADATGSSSSRRSGPKNEGWAIRPSRLAWTIPASSVPSCRIGVHCLTNIEDYLHISAKRGTRMKRITLDGGARVGIFTPPPSGFDPLTASAADLAKHGFPLPELPQHRERFQRIFRQMKNRFRYVVPEFRLNRKKRHGPATVKPVTNKPVIQAGNEINGIWSGAHVYAPAGQAFRWMVGQWMVPNVSAPPTNEEYYCAVWIGIDGDGGIQSGDVCQVGVNCDVTRSGNSSSVSIYPWWEWYDFTADTGQMAITNLTVSAGDTVAVTICTTGPGATDATVFFANITSGIGTSFVMYAEPGVSLVGNCAEWIVESPLVNGQPSKLADYGEVFFSGCEAVSYAPDNSALTIAGGGTQNYIDMYPFGSSTMVSHGILVTPTIVQCVYYGPAA
jgi:hypothetical protein